MNLEKCMSCGSDDLYDPDDYGRVVCAECEAGHYRLSPMGDDWQCQSLQSRECAEAAQNMVSDDW